MVTYPPTTSKLSVRFNEAGNKVEYIPNHNELCESERSSIWYNDSDYRLFKRRLAATVKRFHSSRRTGCEVLVQVYEQAGMAQERANIWCTNYGPLRGIEKVTNKNFEDVRNRDKAKVQFTVLFVQAELKKKFGRVDVDRLAAASEIFSQKATEFAAKMGLADAYAAQQDLITHHDGDQEELPARNFDSRKMIPFQASTNLQKIPRLVPNKMSPVAA